MSAPRLLLISRCPPYPLHLGDRLIVYHLAEELEQIGWEIDLIALTNRPQDAAEVGAYDHLFRRVTLFPEARRSPISYLRRLLLPGARWPSSAAQSWQPEMWRSIEAHVREGEYDALHLFGGIHVYEMVGALGERRAIITPYESYTLYLTRALAAARGAARLTAATQRALAARYESFMFAPYAATVVVSEPDAETLRTLNPALPVLVIPNGVDTYTFRPRPVGRIPALLFVGNYEYPPNVDAALRLATEIFPAVQAEVPEARLWLVGNAPPPALMALASESVRVTGRVPDVRPYLARAGAFVSPLRLGAGIKNKVLEALAMGCPVAATPLSVDGIAVLDGESALIAPAEGLAAACVRLLRDPDLRTRMGVAGRALIEQQYSWAGVAAQYAALYREVG